MATGARPLVGVIHLGAISGPDALDIHTLLQRAEADAHAYHQAGFDALLVENFGDAPYPKTDSPPHVAAILTRISHHVRHATGLPVGVNVLRNDAKTALGVAVAAPCDFIRVNVLTRAVVADQGIIEGCAHELATYRRTLGPHARDVLIAADVDVKHATPLAKRAIEQEAHDMVHRAGADILLVTGPATGAAAELEKVRTIRAHVDAPVWVASGVTPETVAETLEVAQGAIIGSAAKKDCDALNEVDPERARRIAQAAGKTTRG